MPWRDVFCDLKSIRRVLGLVASAVLACCAPRGEIYEIVDGTASGEQSVLQDAFVVTDRVALQDPPFYSGARAHERAYAAFEISIPKDRAPGQIEWRDAGETADPSSHFLTRSHRSFGTDTRAFTERLTAELATRPQASREIIVFVHGFNNNFPEALYRFAQITHDFGTPAVPVLFSWASAGNSRGYLYDRDSALLARDDLAATLMDLDRLAQGRVTLAAHSMGGFLAVEALRHLALTGQGAVVDRLDGLVLFSPDIDVALFQQQAQAIGTLPDPTVIMASRRDRALRLSARITGQEARLGSVGNSDGLDELGVTVLDVTSFNSDADSSHMVGLTSPSLIALLQRADRNPELVGDLLEHPQPGLTSQWGR